MKNTVLILCTALLLSSCLKEYGDLADSGTYLSPGPYPNKTVVIHQGGSPDRPFVELPTITYTQKAKESYDKAVREIRTQAREMTADAVVIKNSRVYRKGENEERTVIGTIVGELTKSQAQREREAEEMMNGDDILQEYIAIPVKYEENLDYLIGYRYKMTITDSSGHVSTIIIDPAGRRHDTELANDFHQWLYQRSYDYMYKLKGEDWGWKYKKQANILLRKRFPLDKEKTELYYLDRDQNGLLTSTRIVLPGGLEEQMTTYFEGNTLMEKVYEGSAYGKLTEEVYFEKDNKLSRGVFFNEKDEFLAEIEWHYLKKEDIAEVFEIKTNIDYASD